MATVTKDPAPTNLTTDGTSFVSSSFTPAADDLLVVFVYGAVTSSISTLTSSAGLTFSDIVQNTGTGISLYGFIADSLAANTSQTVTFDCTGESATAVVIEIFRIAGCTVAGAAAVRQYAQVVSGGGGATVRTTFSTAALTGNVILTCTCSTDSTPGLTEPSGFTFGNETITATPADAMVTAYTDSGFTGTQVDFGGTFGASWKMITVEIQPDGPPAGGQPKIKRLGGIPFAKHNQGVW